MISRAIALAGLIRKGRETKEQIASLEPRQRIRVMQAKIAAQNLDGLLNFLEEAGRFRSQQEEADIRKAAGAILILTEALKGAKATAREEAITAISAEIHQYARSLG